MNAPTDKEIDLVLALSTAVMKLKLGDEYPHVTRWWFREKQRIRYGWKRKIEKIEQLLVPAAQTQDGKSF